jgi:hypothetical protein
VTAVHREGKRRFTVAGHWASPRPIYATELSAENYRIVERNGTRIGSFFVRYW